MNEYAKFRLKNKDELAALLDGRDNLFVAACNKCFAEFTFEDSAEYSAFELLAAQLGKNIAGRAKIDFLCDKTMTMKKLRLPRGAENIFVISCGLGIQSVADFAALPVFAACDSIPSGGSHGLAFSQFRCEGCGQCYLNVTGGICSVTDCAKGLLNGQCGGSKNGRCETNAAKECAWERIQRRLERQGGSGDFVNQDTQLRNYGKVNYAFVSARVRAARERRFEGCAGVHIDARKELNEHIALKNFPAVKTLVIPLRQHAGAEARPLVKAGDTVRAGQKIGEACGFVSAAVHASVSGKVTAVEPRRHPFSGVNVLSVIIENDGLDTIHESVKPAGNLEELKPDDIVNIVREKGIAGMGGAAFPTSVKLTSAKSVDTAILNGCECEPLLASDHRVMLEYADDVIFGLRAIIKATGARRGVIAIEDNKRDAVEMMREKAARFSNIEIVAVKTKYPQGAEKMLVWRVTGQRVPRGGLPMDAGCVVCNVSTARAIAAAVLTGMPLVERVVSVSGEKIAAAGNFIVKIGTPVREIIEYCGGAANDAVVKLGGPMMGIQCENLDTPVVKGCNGIIAVEAVPARALPCVSCGRCADVCPMELVPMYYPAHAAEQNWSAMNQKNVRDCIECGCCEFICPSKIPIIESIKAGKSKIAAGAEK